MDGKISLEDAVWSEYVLKNSIVPTPLQAIALDHDENGALERFDFVVLFRAFLLAFLAS